MNHFVTWVASLTSTCQYHERFDKPQPDFDKPQPETSQEFVDAKKFYGSKNPNNLKRIILKSKRNVLFLIEKYSGKEEKNTLYIYCSENFSD